VRKQFTGYEQDNETELDYAQARYFANARRKLKLIEKKQKELGYTKISNVLMGKQPLKMVIAILRD
ncbi:MAG: hypothetical protein KF756_13860, partial [Acidobacteria bacterium]|nr:hypothetical protein [Acidobacteriota bacterium]